MRVKCVTREPIDRDDPVYPSLMPGNIYIVIQAGTHLYEIIDDAGEPLYFDKRRFEVIDNRIDEHFVVETDNEGRVAFNSPEMSDYGSLLYHYHNLKFEAIKAFDTYVLDIFTREFGELERITNHPNKHHSFGNNLLPRINYDFNDPMIMDVRCINSLPIDPEQRLWPDLIRGNVYSVLGIEGDYYRILGALGKPYLYHKSRFELVEMEKGQDWEKRIYDNIGEVRYPTIELMNDFFEEYFLYNLKARAIVLFYASEIQQKKIDKIYDENLMEKLIPEDSFADNPFFG